MASAGTTSPTRREQILATAAELFAARGFHGVSVADLGAACGISGPALYKHFVSKDAVLAEMLVSISERLLSVGRERVAAADGDPGAALRALVDWHVDFALRHRALIVVQDRDWESLPVEAREQVRALQRAYVDLWAAEHRRLVPGASLGAGTSPRARRVRPDQLHPAQRPAPRRGDAGVADRHGARRLGRADVTGLATRKVSTIVSAGKRIDARNARCGSLPGRCRRPARHESAPAG